MIKRTTNLLIAGIVCLFSYAANAAPSVEFVNNTSSVLNFSIAKNGQYTPDLPSTFTLSPNKGFFGEKAIVSAVLKSGFECESTPYNSPSTYIRVTNENGSAFLGVGQICHNDNEVEVSGFIGQGIAYSWKNNQALVKVIFCDPKDYPCEG